MDLVDDLDIPPRDRNALLKAAGYPPLSGVGSMNDPILGTTIDLILAAQEPNPACAINNRWQVVARNGAFERLIAGVDRALLAPPMSLLRIMLHPAGLAPRIENLRDWKRALTHRAHRHYDLSRDPVLGGMLDELHTYPNHPSAGIDPHMPGVAVPLRLVTIDGTLSVINTTTTFAAAKDVTLSELFIETYFPIDETTATLLRAPVRPVVLPATTD